MSFSKKFATSRIALLDLGEEVVDENPEDDGAADFAEADEQTAEIDSTLNAVDDGTNDINELNGIADTLEDTQEDGGASTGEIELAEVAVEHRIMNLTKSKLLPAKRLLPATESFVGIKSRPRATQLAVEGIRDWASQARDSIMVHIDKAVTYFKGVGTSVKAGLDKAYAELGRIKEGIKSGEITFSGTMKAIPGAVWGGLCNGGKFTKEVFSSGVDKMSAFITRMTEFLKSWRNGVKASNPEEIVADASTGVATESDDGESTSTDDAKPGIGTKLKTKLTSVWAATISFIKSFGSKKKELGEGIAAVTSNDVLPGDTSVTIIGPVASSARIDSALAGVKVEINGGDGGSGEEVATFKNGSEAISVIDKLMGLIDKAKVMVMGSSEAATIAEGTVTEIKKITDETGSATGGEGATPESRARRAINRVKSFFSGIISGLTRASNVVTSFVTKYVRIATDAISAFCGKVKAAASTRFGKKTEAPTEEAAA